MDSNISASTARATVINARGRKARATVARNVPSSSYSHSQRREMITAYAKRTGKPVHVVAMLDKLLS
jgi:hypothetical protein